MKGKLHTAARFVNSTTHLTATVREMHTKSNTHLHDYYELELILSGEGEQNLNGSVYPLRAGSFYLLTPIDFHSVTAKTPLTLINLSFDETMLPMEWRLYFMNRRTDLFFHTEGEEFSRLSFLFSMAEAESTADDPHADEMRRHLLSLLLIAIARKEPASASARPLTLQRSMQYLFRHFRDPLTLSQIAAESGYTPHYFSTLFHRETGKKLTDFLNDLRLNYAKMLLTTTDLSATAICEESGFGSESNFFRLFQDQFGCTPTQYRKK